MSDPYSLYLRSLVKAIVYYMLVELVELAPVFQNSITDILSKSEKIQTICEIANTP